MNEQLADADFRSGERMITLDTDFNTYGEKMAFLKGLTFEYQEKVEVLAWSGCFDDFPDDAGKYTWSLVVHPR